MDTSAPGRADLLTHLSLDTGIPAGVLTHPLIQRELSDLSAIWDGEPGFTGIVFGDALDRFLGRLERRWERVCATSGGSR